MKGYDYDNHEKLALPVIRHVEAFSLDDWDRWVEPISKTLHYCSKPCRNHSCPVIRKVDLAKSLYAPLC